MTDTYRLLSPRLPNNKSDIIHLVDEYFANIHPLRCFGFIHKPSLMRRIDEGIADGSDGHAILCVVCALGAKYLITGITKVFRANRPIDSMR